MIKDNIIDNNDLAKVTGGAKADANTVESSPEELVRFECPYCHDFFRANRLYKRLTCPWCHKIIEIKG